MSVEITLDGEYLWSSDSMSNRLIIPQGLKTEYNKSGSFSFTMLPTCPLYDSAMRMKSQVVVFIDDEPVFRGRVLDITGAFDRQRTVVCEGDLSYLLDSCFSATEVTCTPADLFRRLINEHNYQMDKDSGSAFKKFVIGEINVSSEVNNDSEKFEIQSAKSVKDVIDEFLIGSYGGFLRTREQAPGYPALIDWISDNAYGETTDSISDIEFGLNLLTLEYEPPIEEVFSVLLPIGYNKLKLSGLPDDPYIISSSAVAKYGFIVKAQSFDDVKTMSKLRTEGQKFLEKYTKDYPDTLTVKAVDLFHLHKADIDRPIRLGDKVAVFSDPHNIDYDASTASKTVRCLAIEYDLTNPSNNTYVLGVYIPPDKKRKVASATRMGGGSYKRSSYNLGKTPTLNIPSFTGLGQGTVDKAKSIIKDSVNDAISGNKWLDLAKKGYDTLSGVFNGGNGLNSGTLYDFVNGVKDFGSNIVSEGVSSFWEGASGTVGTISGKAVELFGVKETVEDNRAELVEKHEDNVVRIGTAEQDIIVTANALTVEVARATGEESRIEVYAQGINAEVTSARNGEASLSARLSIMADGISSRVEKKDYNATTIASLINQTAEAVTIQAGKINLIGYVTASEISADRAYIDSLRTTGGLQVLNGKLFAPTVTAGTVNTTNFSIMNENGLIVSDRSGVAHTIADTGHYHHFTEGQDGTIYISSATSTQGNFNIAATKTYKDGVAAAIASVNVNSWDWKFGETYLSNSKEYIVYPKVTLSNEKEFYPTAGLRVDASDAYDAGYDDGEIAGKASVSVTGWDWKFTETYLSNSKEYLVYPQATLSNSNRYYPNAGLRVDASDAYNAGYDDGEDAGGAGVSVTSWGWKYNATYLEDSNEYVVYPKATLSNSKEYYSNAGLRVDASDAYTYGNGIGYLTGYDEGFQAGEASTFVTEWGMVGTPVFANNKFTIYPKVKLSSDKTYQYAQGIEIDATTQINDAKDSVDIYEWGYAKSTVYKLRQITVYPAVTLRQSNLHKYSHTADTYTVDGTIIVDDVRIVGNYYNVQMHLQYSDPAVYGYQVYSFPRS